MTFEMAPCSTVCIPVSYSECVCEELYAFLVYFAPKIR